MIQITYKVRPETRLSDVILGGWFIYNDAVYKANCRANNQRDVEVICVSGNEQTSEPFYTLLSGDVCVKRVRKVVVSLEVEI